MKKAPGLLPNAPWLIRNGFSGLVRMMGRYPDAFAHITQDTRQYRFEATIMLAEKVSKENGGMLPRPTELKRLGVGRLMGAIHAYPEHFAHIKQEGRRGKFQKPDARVRQAEKLAKLNGGILPGRRWLEKNGYNAINMLRRRRPHLFSHIRHGNRDNRTLPAGMKWLPVVEKLVKLNGGLLPPRRWLRAKGFTALTNSMKKHRGVFKHIKRDRHPQWRGKKSDEPRSAEEWLMKYGWEDLLIVNPEVTYLRLDQ